MKTGPAMRGGLVLLLALSARGLHALVPADPPARSQNQPAAPSPAAAPGGSSTNTLPREQRLKNLLEQYRAGQISAADYHRDRATIMQPPGGFPGTQAAAEKPSAAAPADTPSFTPPSISPAQALGGALVPGADVVFRLDLKAMRQTPAYRALNTSANKQAKTRPTHAASATLPKILLETVGAEGEGVDAVWISADLDGLKMTASGLDQESLGAFPVIAAVQLGKPITVERLKAVVRELAADGGDATAVQLTEETVPHGQVVRVEAASRLEQPAFFTVCGDRTIFVAMNRDALGKAIERTAAKPAELEPRMGRVMETIGSGCQLKAGVALPYALRKSLGELTQSPQAGPAAMLGGLKDLQSLAVTMTLDDGLLVEISSDLGSPEAASGIHLLVGMLKPQVSAAFAGQLGLKPAELPDNLFTTDSKGSIIKLKLALGKPLLTALQEGRKTGQNKVDKTSDADR